MWYGGNRKKTQNTELGGESYAGIVGRPFRNHLCPAGRDCRVDKEVQVTTQSIKEEQPMFIFAAILFVILTVGVTGVFTMMDRYM